MKKALILIVSAALILSAVWYFLLRDTSEGDTGQQSAEVTETQDFPVRAEDAPTTVESEQFSDDLDGITFSHPSNWNVTEGADNSEDTQLYTAESPLDTNEFYFCLDLYVVGADSEISFESSDIEVLSVEPMQNELSSIIYKLTDAEPVYWNATEVTPEVGDNTFTRKITYQNGAQIQAFGRFNCREQTPVELTVDEFKESRWLNEAKTIIGSIEL